MYDQLVQVISQFYPQDQKRGLFLTCMNGNAVIGSVGVMSTDHVWTDVLAKFYKNFSSQATPITSMICDIVIDAQEVTDYTSLKGMHHEEVGLVLCSPDGTQLGALLPQTAGIQNLSQGLAYMKQKYQFEGMVNVFVIKTDRKVVVSTTK